MALKVQDCRLVRSGGKREKESVASVTVIRSFKAFKMEGS